MQVNKKQEVIEREETDFDQVVEEYFAQFEVVETEEEVNERIEKEAMRRYQKIKNDQQQRLDSIHAEIDTSLVKAALVEKNQKQVEQVLSLINGILNEKQHNKMDAILKHKTEKGDEIAAMIKSVKLVS